MPNDMRERFLCLDCRVDTSAIGEYYSVHPRLWAQATSPVERRGMLCIGCLEARLGRRLTPADFTAALINKVGGRSARLRNRAD